MNLEGGNCYLEGEKENLEGTWRSATLQVKSVYSQEVKPENSQLGGDFQKGIGRFCTTGLFSSDIFTEFSRELRLKGYSENTILSTLYNVNQFFKETGVSPRQAGPSDIVGYLCNLYELRGHCAQSIRTILNSLKRFYSYLHRTGQIFSDPALEIESPDVNPCFPKQILSINDMEAIRKAVSGTSLLKRRDKAIIEVLYSTGLRLSELASLNIEDIDLNTGILSVQKGKGGRDRRAILNTAAVASLRAYLECRMKTPATTTALWINYKGNRLSGQMIRRLLNRYAETAGVTTPAHPHAWRHGLATALLRLGASIVEVQRFLGHVSARSTQIYTHVLIRDLQEIHRQCHPREFDYEKMEGRKDEWRKIDFH